MKKKNRISLYPFIVFVLFLIISCKKDNNSPVPILTTSDVNNITATTAISGGNITSDGGLIITTRGVCWSMVTNPTINDNKTINDAGVGSFTSLISGLTVSTTYYLRAYATNSSGTGYGDEISFSTNKIPSLTTTAISTITDTTAVSGGTIISDGGFTITARGVCWSTGTNPTINDSKTINGTGVWGFTSLITGLTANTAYYVRAYATNSAGTGYGIVRSFKTVAAIDIDGNVYHTVIIGKQVWMVENLKVTKYSNGNAIPNVPYNWNLTTGAYCDYNNDKKNATTYGRLYNWYTVNDSRNIAPIGWHIPTDDEWTTLTTYLGGDSIAGDKLKETGKIHWWSSTNEVTNESGFTALPGGCRSYNGFEDIGRNGYWWSSIASETSAAYGRRMGYDGNYVHRGRYDMGAGFSIRCIRN